MLRPMRLFGFAVSILLAYGLVGLCNAKTAVSDKSVDERVCCSEAARLVNG